MLSAVTNVIMTGTIHAITNPITNAATKAAMNGATNAIMPVITPALTAITVRIMNVTMNVPANPVTRVLKVGEDAGPATNAPTFRIGLQSNPGRLGLFRSNQLRLLLPPSRKLL